MAQVFVPPVESDRFPPPAPDERLWPETAWPVESPISMQAPPPAGAPASLSPAAAGAPPGWYPEPPRERFWDGARWTGDTRPTGPAPVAVPVAAAVAVAPVPVTAPVPAPVTMAPVPVASVMPEPPRPPSLPDAAPVAESRGLAHELVTLVLVLGLAIAAGALVTAIGIVFTV